MSGDIISTGPSIFIHNRTVHGQHWIYVDQAINKGA